MLEQKLAAARSVADGLAAVEAAVDRALIEAAELTARMPQAWQKANVSIVVGMGAFDRVSAVVGALSQARREAGEAHRILDAVREKIGVPEMGWGDKPYIETEMPDNVVPIAA